MQETYHWLPPDAKNCLLGLLRRMLIEGGHVSVCLEGAEGSGKTSLVYCVAESFGLPLLVVRAGRLKGHANALRQSLSISLVRQPCILLLGKVDCNP
jgi:replication-associated recombination protein RarA